MKWTTASLALGALVSSCGGRYDGDGAPDAATDARRDAATDGGKADATQNDGGHPDACPPGSVACGPICADLGTDPKNCGACGADCEGTTCEGGQCTMVFVQGAIPVALAVDATNLYWTNGSSSPEHGMLMKVPKSGGQQPTPLAFNQYQPGGLAVSATDAYWSTNAPDAGIMTMPTLGGAPKLVVGNLLDGIQRVAIDTQRVYWASDYAPGVLAAAPLDGGAPTVLAANQASPHDFAIGATHLYWTVETGIMRMPLGGGPPEALATARKPTALAIDGASVYWLELGTPGGQYLDGALVKMPLGGGPQTVLASGLRWTSSLALDATYAWWTNAGTQSSGFTDGTVMRVPLAGGPVVTLATKQNLCRGLVLDAKRAYWINDASGVPGLIMRATK